VQALGYGRPNTGGAVYDMRVVNVERPIYIATTGPHSFNSVDSRYDPWEASEDEKEEYRIRPGCFFRYKNTPGRG
jgi:hypothetical protein